MENDRIPSTIEESPNFCDSPLENAEFKFHQKASVPTSPLLGNHTPSTIPDVKSGLMKRIHRERIVGWDGTVWQESSHSEMSTDSEYSPARSSSEDEPTIKRPVRFKKKTNSMLSEDDYDDDDTNRHALDHKQKMAKAIASKYRLGGRMATPKTVATGPAKKISSISRDKAEASLLVPGALVWALVPQKHQLPWWAGAVVARPVKRRSKDGCEVCLYRIALLCPPRSLQSEACVLLPPKNLRPFHGRAAFDDFMRSVLGSATNKLLALAQFVIPPLYEQLWHTARDQIESAFNQTGKSIQARFKFLGINIDSLLVRWKTEDDLRRRKLAKTKALVKDKTSDVNTSKIIPFKNVAPKLSGRLTISLKYQNRMLPKHDVFAFEVLISQSHVTPTRARFICCVCFKPGQLQVKKKKVDDDGTSVCGGKASRVASALLDRLKTVKPIVRRIEKSSKDDSCHPLLVPCAGRCANFIHLECAAQSSSVLEESKGQPTCALCRAGLRQCSICMEMQPFGDDEHRHGEVVAMQRCSVSHCHRWFHTTTCLRQLPFAALVREGRADTFTCPAHSCLACFADAPGTRPRPSQSLLHCLLCAVTYHPGEWCLPAGSIFLSASWIICPRHALQGIPASLFQFTRRPPIQTLGAITEPLSIDVGPSPPPPPVGPKENIMDADEPEFEKIQGPPICTEPKQEESEAVKSPEIPADRIEDASRVNEEGAVGENDQKKAVEIGPKALEQRPTVEELIPQLPVSKIVFPDTKRAQLNTMFRPANVSWCFICSKGGRIICCENCPASFHQECLNVKDVPEQFLCEDCMNGRSPRYGEIVWARLPPSRQRVRVLSNLSGALPLLEHAFPPPDCAGVLAGMRWWPAEILHARSLRPTSESSTSLVDRYYERLGFFPVRLFDVYTARGNFNGVEGVSKALSKSEVVDEGKRMFPVCLWTTRSRVFPYEEGDDDRDDISDDEEEEDSAGENSQPGVSSDSGDCNSSNASMADEDPIMLNLSASPDDLTSPHPVPPAPASRLLMMTSPGRDRHTSGGSDHLPTCSPPTSRPRRRAVAPPEKKKEHNKKAGGKKRNSGGGEGVVGEQERKAVYRKAVQHAAEGWNARKETFAKQMGRTRRPDYYRPIKTNYPIGSVRVYRYTDLLEASQCDCKASDPCGPNSGCINRALLYECVPSVCPHKADCRNQCFTRRDYPLQRPFWTGDDRGWGLKTLAPIRKGDFVNEYIGDLIDEEEANRRLRFCHENNITNYYMMQMDSQRIIDAGPKGNLSRFMNHSCCPNLNTQKWTVNGDTRVGLFAVRDIAAGEELTFNYNFCAHGQEMLNCRCGADGCAGFLGARHDPSTATTTSASGTTTLSTEGNGRNTPILHPTSAEEPSTTTASKRGSSAVAADRNQQLESSEFDRQEPVCYRCGNENHSTSAAGSSVTSGRLRRHRHASKHNSDDDEDDESNDQQSVASSVSSSATGVTVAATTTAAKPLLHCAKEDCCKAYHLQCLDLEKVPKGRWVCPWHHCDACGRPATVFCMRCTSSFCPGHVEGSVFVLPPANENEPAEVVCLSHTDVIAEEGVKSSDSGGINDDEEEEEEEEEDNLSECGASNSSQSDKTTEASEEPPKKVPRNPLTDSAARKRRSTAAALKAPSASNNNKKNSSSMLDDKSMFRELAASCKRRGAQLERLQKLMASP